MFHLIHCDPLSCHLNLVVVCFIATDWKEMCSILCASAFQIFEDGYLLLNCHLCRLNITHLYWAAGPSHPELFALMGTCRKEYALDIGWPLCTGSSCVETSRYTLCFPCSSPWEELRTELPRLSCRKDPCWRIVSSSTLKAPCQPHHTHSPLVSEAQQGWALFLTRNITES